MRIKFHFFIFLFFISMSSYGQEIKFHSAVDTLSINGFSFVFKVQRSYSEYSPMAKDTVLLIYRLEKGKEKLLVKHFLYMWSADCNNVFRDYGKVEINEDKIILTTDYTQQRSDPIPDYRKRIYKVNEKGQLILLSDKEGRY
ncbi:MAG: hypothetical protein IAF38_11965 [Bacteroidia bacterium]|nr:hypothetical protein [Bacteroidia bacterium]